MNWIIAAAILAVVATFFVFLKRRQDEVEDSYQKRFSGKSPLQIEKQATYIARESDGRSHFRESGYLVLSEDELYFAAVLSRKKVIIPAARIIKAEQTGRLAGQSPGGMMVKVVFKTPDGKQDAIAWRVSDPKRWLEEIEKVVNA